MPGEYIYSLKLYPNSPASPLAFSSTIIWILGFKRLNIKIQERWDLKHQELQIPDSCPEMTWTRRDVLREPRGESDVKFILQGRITVSLNLNI